MREIKYGIALGLLLGAIICSLEVNVGGTILLCFVLLIFLGNYCHKIEDTCKKNKCQWKSIEEAEQDPCVSDICRKDETPWYEITLLDEKRVERSLKNEESNC